MSGVFGGGSRPAPEPSTPVLASPAAAPAPAAGLGETRSPVTRASTMLSPRRREDEMRPTVGTKQLLGQ